MTYDGAASKRRNIFNPVIGVAVVAIALLIRNLNFSSVTTLPWCEPSQPQIQIISKAAEINISPQNRINRESGWENELLGCESFAIRPPSKTEDDAFPQIVGAAVPGKPETSTLSPTITATCHDELVEFTSIPVAKRNASPAIQWDYEVLYKAEGRLLGVQWLDSFRVILCDTHRGLLRVTHSSGLNGGSPTAAKTPAPDHARTQARTQAQAEVELLAGDPLCNSIYLADAGDILFTSSSEFSLDDLALGALFRPSGMLRVYQPQTMITRDLYGGLHFANGVQCHHMKEGEKDVAIGNEGREARTEEEHLLCTVAETFKGRLHFLTFDRNWQLISAEVRSLGTVTLDNIQSLDAERTGETSRRDTVLVAANTRLSKRSWLMLRGLTGRLPGANRPYFVEFARKWLHPLASSVMTALRSKGELFAIDVKSQCIERNQRFEGVVDGLSEGFHVPKSVYGQIEGPTDERNYVLLGTYKPQKLRLFHF